MSGPRVKARVNHARASATCPWRAFSRAQLLTEAFGFDHYALDRTVDVHVMNLRRKIEEKAAEPQYLLTVYGVGYKMAEEVPGGDAS